MMTKKELFAGWNERMFLDDPAAVAAYCRTYWPEDPYAFPLPLHEQLGRDGEPRAL